MARVSGRGRRVLVVDDDLAIRVLLDAVLSRLKFEVVLAEDGAAGLEELHKGPAFNLVLIDLNMPKLDGYEMIRRIQKIAFDQRPHIIVFTAAGHLGVDRIQPDTICNSILKPFDLERFLELVSECVEENHVPIQSTSIS